MDITTGFGPVIVGSNPAGRAYSHNKVGFSYLVVLLEVALAGFERNPAAIGLRRGPWLWRSTFSISLCD